MEKFRLYTFAACAVVCGGFWLFAVVTALFDIGQLGIAGFIFAVFVMTLMLGFPLLFLANVLGIAKLASK